MDQVREKILMKEIGERLKKYRKAKKLSLRSLGNLAEMDYTNISAIEQGKSNPSTTTIIFLAEALGVDPCRLIKD